MKRLRLAMVLWAFFGLMLPTIAHAGLIELIDQWSGPGPFFGAAFDWRLVCFSDPEENVVRQGENDTIGSTFVGLIGPGCFFKKVPPKSKRVASLNLAVGLYKAKENNLPYSDPAVNKDVWLTSLEPSFWVRVGRGVELGTGVGIFWVTGPAFESFRRVYLRPIQIDVKPWVRRTDPFGSLWELISVRAGLLIMPGIDAADLGALPGYETNREVLKTFSVMIDLEPVMNRLKR